MKKSHIIIIISLLAFVVSLYMWGGKFSTSNLSSETPIPTVVKTWEDKTTREDNSELNYTISVMYPQFTGLSNANSQEHINTAIQTLSDGQIAEFKKGISPNLVLPTQMQKVKNELIIQSNIVRADNAFVSVHFSIMQAYPGQAHPENSNLTFNYDVKGDRELSIDDLFKPDSGYVNVLSQLTKKILLEKPEMKDNPNAADFISEGAAPKAENFTLFTLSEETLTIVFNPAMVAPDYVGTETAPISFLKLSDILNPDLSL